MRSLLQTGCTWLSLVFTQINTESGIKRARKNKRQMRRSNIHQTHTDAIGLIMFVPRQLMWVVEMNWQSYHTSSPNGRVTGLLLGRRAAANVAVSCDGLLLPLLNKITEVARWDRSADPSFVSSSAAPASVCQKKAITILKYSRVLELIGNTQQSEYSLY